MRLEILQRHLVLFLSDRALIESVAEARQPGSAAVEVFCAGRLISSLAGYKMTNTGVFSQCKHAGFCNARALETSTTAP